METRIYDFQVRVLVTRDEEQYVAHALEMDLVAYADTEKGAMEEVANMMQNQISFAIEKNQNHLTDFRAPQECFDEWEKVHNAALQGLATGQSPSTSSCGTIQIRASALVFKASDIKGIRNRLHTRKAFELTPVCA